MPSASFLSCFREEEPCHLPVYQPFLLGSSRFAGNGLSSGTSLALCLWLGAGQDRSCSPEHPGSEPATAWAGGFVHRSSVLRETEPLTFQAFMARSRAALAQGLGQTLCSLGMCRSEPRTEESFLIALPGDEALIFIYLFFFAGFHQEITQGMGEPRCCQGLAEALLLSSPPVLSSRAGAALTLCPRADPLCTKPHGCEIETDSSPELVHAQGNINPAKTETCL